MSDEEQYSGDESEDVEELEEAPPVIVPKRAIIVAPENRRTSNIMSVYEMTENVSIRATLIEKYADCFVDVSDLDEPIAMARRELMMRMSPLKLERCVGSRTKEDGSVVVYYEVWNPNEMQFSMHF